MMTMACPHGDKERNPTGDALQGIIDEIMGIAMETGKPVTITIDSAGATASSKKKPEAMEPVKAAMVEPEAEPVDDDVMNEDELKSIPKWARAKYAERKKMG